MKVLLSQEEMEEFCVSRDCKGPGWTNDHNAHIDACQECATLAQARHLLKVLNEPCKEHPQCTNGPGGASDDWYYTQRYGCPACMAEIEQEIG